MPRNLRSGRKSLKKFHPRRRRRSWNCFCLKTCWRSNVVEEPHSHVSSCSGIIETLSVSHFASTSYLRFAKVAALEKCNFFSLEQGKFWSRELLESRIMGNKRLWFLSNWLPIDEFSVFFTIYWCIFSLPSPPQAVSQGKIHKIPMKTFSSLA